MARTPRTRLAPAGTLCDSNAGRCGSPATIDFGRYVRVVGIPGEVRYLCCRCGTGTRGHRLVCPNHTEET